MTFELLPVGAPAGAGGTVPAVQIQGDVDAANATEVSDALRGLASPALTLKLWAKIGSSDCTLYKSEKVANPAIKSANESFR